MFKFLRQARKNILVRRPIKYVTPISRKFALGPNKPSDEASMILKKIKGIAFITAAVTVLSAIYFGRKRHPKLQNLSNTSSAADNNSDNLRKQFNFIDKVVKKCAPSVVYIEIKDSKRLDPETGAPMTASNGSGFLIREDGWIITNAHVVINKPHATINVMMHDGSNYEATVEDADVNVDLALLKINSNKTFPYLKLGKSVDTLVGEWVIALGSPLSLSHSVTVGVVSSINREASELGLKNYSMKYIQTDASITFGNSGGPLVNLDGDVIGINNLRITSGISFAIPVDYVKGFLDRSKYLTKNVLNDENRKNDMLLGITTFKLTPHLIRELTQEFIDMPETINHGVLVWKVVKGAPAQMSGLEPGDIITHIDGLPVKDTSDIYLLLGNKKEKSTQKLQILRQGKRRELYFKSV